MGLGLTGKLDHAWVGAWVLVHECMGGGVSVGVVGYIHFKGSRDSMQLCPSFPLGELRTFALFVLPALLWGTFY